MRQREAVRPPINARQRTIRYEQAVVENLPGRILCASDADPWLATEPDYNVLSISARAKTVPAGRELTVGATVRNDGWFGQTSVRYVLSKDTIYGNGDDVPLLLTSDRGGEEDFDTGQTVSLRTTVQIPPKTKPGHYSLLACIDPQETSADTNRDNNIRSGPGVTVTKSAALPDLTVKLFHPRVIPTVRMDEDSPIQVVVSNIGNGAFSGKYRIRLYDGSDDQLFRFDPMELAAATFSGRLAPKASRTVTLNLNILFFENGYGRIFAGIDQINPKAQLTTLNDLDDSGLLVILKM